MDNNLDEILEKTTDATLESLDEQQEISDDQQSDTNADTNDNSELIEKLNAEIIAIESKMSELQDKLDKINESMQKLMDDLNKKNADGKFILSQGYTTFNWLMNNMDKYWTDMEGSVRNECMEYYKKLNDESTGPIAVVKSEAASVLSAATVKRDELAAEIETYNSELNSLNEQLASLQ
mgnify:FL=1